MADNRNRRLPNDASLTDDGADRRTSVFSPMGPGPGSIVRELVARSGSPEVGMLIARHGGTDGLCETCQLPPYREVQEGHPYVPIVNRLPGVHPTVDDGRARNSRPGDAGESAFQLVDPDIASGLAEARWNHSASRQRESQGAGPT
jgi:hypothetical protein